jgi:4-hydroxybenzoate polyprenyltransferase
MLPPLLKLLRPADWVKNVFVLVPAVFWLAGDPASREGGSQPLVLAFLAAVAFSAAGSGFYAINDALDAQEDRAHPVKCRRPVASGAISPRTAVAVGVGLEAIALGLAWWIRPGVFAVLVAYVVAQVAYNARLKRVRLVDVVTVASGFVLRAIAGALAIGIAVSAWLVVVVFAFTLFLGFVKRLGDLRAAELQAAAGHGSGWKPRAGYDSAEDLNWLLAVTGTAAMMSYVVYALSAHAREIFGIRAVGFALLSPLVFIVVHRLYLRANLGKADSPVTAILADRSALLSTVLFVAGVLAALYWPPAAAALGTVFD